MPAEWERHRATWLSWPHKEASWPGKLQRIPPIFVAMVRALVAGEAVHILVNDSAPAGQVAALLEGAGIAARGVRLHEIPTDDAWVRDHGPTFITRPGAHGGELAIVDWKYNAWGGKYPPWELDDRVPRAIAERLAVTVFSPGIVMEGGSIDVDGRGTLLTTEACLLNPNRNPQLRRADIEQYLCDYLGVRRVLWLGDGIAGDDTDGHVDDLTRFVAPGVVVTVLEDDPADENHLLLLDNLRRLEAMHDAAGNRLHIVTLPMPEPVVYEGNRLPASYANFYIGNAVDLVWGLGAFHCLTQQQPAA